MAKYKRPVKPVAPAPPPTPAAPSINATVTAPAATPTAAAPLARPEGFPPITEFLRGKIAARRIRWVGVRYAINFGTAAIFFGLLFTTQAPANGREDFLAAVRSVAVFGELVLTLYACLP